MNSYSIETTYEEFLKKEQEKNPELNVNDIESLKEKVKTNADLPHVRGTNVYKCRIITRICFLHDFIALFLKTLPNL